MGNTLNCSENLCQDNIYEMSWISDKNWSIDYEYSEENIPFNLKRGNFKIMNNGNCFFKLMKKIESVNDIEKLLINFLFKYNLSENDNIKIKLILTNNPNELLNSVINTINIKKNSIEIGNENLILSNEFKYEILINFTYLNYIIFNQIVKKNDEIILNNNLNRNIQDDELKDNNELFFGILIYSNLKSNSNMEKYLNLKIV